MVANDTSLPLALLAGAIGLVLVLWILARVRRGRDRNRANGGGRRMNRKSGDIVANLEAERDVLRANHAVEVAELEGKLAEATARAHKDMNAAFRLKEAEEKLAAATEATQEKTRELATANERITALTDELAEARSRATTMGQEDRGTIERLTGERDDARTALERERALAADLRREAEAQRERLAETARETAGTAELRAAMDELRQREAKAAKTVGEQEATIAELRKALEEARAENAKAADADVSAMRETMATLEQREREANAALSRLAYEHDGLKGRLATAERLEREARAEAEKHEALLELRQQKIYALEARLRDRHQEAQSASRRAEAAEAVAASLRSAQDASGDEAGNERIRALSAALETATEDRQRLQIELDELRAATPPAQSYEEAREIAEALNAAQAEVEELRGEVARLRAARPGPASAEVTELREAIRSLAERFLADAGPETEEHGGGQEPTLAERIRAFKATRDAQVRRPLRIAAPKER